MDLLNKVPHPLLNGCLSRNQKNLTIINDFLSSFLQRMSKSRLSYGVLSRALYKLISKS